VETKIGELLKQRLLILTDLRVWYIKKKGCKIYQFSMIIYGELSKKETIIIKIDKSIELNLSEFNRKRLDFEILPE
jgi:hypothetical protein